MMSETGSALIDITEAIYDVESETDAWMQNLLEAGLPLLNDGLGVAAVAVTGRPSGGPIRIHERLSLAGLPDFWGNLDRVVAEWPPAACAEFMRPGVVMTISERAKNYPGLLESYCHHIPGCHDCFGLTAMDLDGRAMLLLAPLRRETRIAPRHRATWSMVNAHLEAGYRLRRAATEGAADLDRPQHAEAVFDPNGFKLSHATGSAKTDDTGRALRQAAIRIDRSRGTLRRKDPAAALEAWTCLADGRWSMVDWFDTDGRRFVLALPNAPEVSDPRQLNPRERVVAAYVAQGDSVKMVGYRLGLSKSAASRAVRGLIKKLGVKTQAQLVAQLRALAASADASSQRDGRSDDLES